MKKMGIFPYSHDWKPILHYQDFLFPDSKVYAVVRPLEGNMQKYQSYLVDYPKCTFDALMLTENFELENKKDYILQMLDQGKEIECYQQLEPDILQELNGRENFAYYAEAKEHGLLHATQKLSAIPVPVIFVLGMYENLDKFAIQLAIRKILQVNSFTVSQIGTKPYCERFGFHSFPRFMLDDSYSPEEKVFLFNRYVADIAEKERTDAIIIGIPGAYNRLNLDYPMGLGILCYLVSQAVTPDFAVMCTFYSEFQDESFFKYMSENCRHRLGFGIDCFHMSGTYIDMDDVKERKRLKYTHISDEAVGELIRTQFKNFESCIFNGYSDSGEEKLSNRLFEILSAPYEEVKVVW